MRFEFVTKIDAPVEKVFAFHERPDIFALLTPPWQRIRIIRRTGGLEVGARVEFAAFGVSGVAVHTEYIRNRLFVDVQERGPFAAWKHRHEFSPDGDGSLLADRIEFRLKGGAIAEACLGWLALLQLRMMFRHRHRVTKQMCESSSVKSRIAG